MLVLSRRIGESIIIDGGRIKIMVTDIRSNQVSLGIVADGMVIDREEIHERRTQTGDFPDGNRSDV